MNFPLRHSLTEIKMSRFLIILAFLLTSLSPLSACETPTAGVGNSAIELASDVKSAFENFNSHSSDSGCCCSSKGSSDCGSCCAVVECGCDQDSRPLPPAPISSSGSSRLDTGKSFRCPASFEVIVSSKYHGLFFGSPEFAAKQSVPLFLLNRSIRT